MSNYIEEVLEFHKTFNHKIEDKPDLTDLKTNELRVNLLQEELDELKEALEQEDIVEVLDALCDIQYVLSGAVLSLGYRHVFNDAFEEVHRSNMSKLCNSVDEAIATGKQNSPDDECEVYKTADKYVVRRIKDGKIIKSINYSKADLKKFI